MNTFADISICENDISIIPGYLNNYMSDCLLIIYCSGNCGILEVQYVCSFVPSIVISHTHFKKGHNHCNRIYYLLCNIMLHLYGYQLSII